MNYYDKYLKYKNKYLNLKKSLDGGSNYTQQEIENMSPEDIDMLFQSQERDQDQGHDKGRRGRGREGRGSEIPMWQKQGYDEEKALEDAIRLSTEEDKKYQEILQSHRDFAARHHMRLVEVEGDGNCFYRCVSFGLTGSVAMHRDFRQIVLEELRANKDKYIAYIAGDRIQDETIDQYIERMGRDTVWADNVELQAFVNSTKVAITLYDMSRNGAVTHMTPDVGTSWKTIQLIYTGIHYNYLE